MKTEPMKHAVKKRESSAFTSSVALSCFLSWCGSPIISKKELHTTGSVSLGFHEAPNTWHAGTHLVSYRLLRVFEVST